MAVVVVVGPTSEGLVWYRGQYSVRYIGSAVQ